MLEYWAGVRITTPFSICSKTFSYFGKKKGEGGGGSFVNIIVLIKSERWKCMENCTLSMFGTSSCSFRILSLIRVLLT